MSSGGFQPMREFYSFRRDLDNLFVEAGRQAHVVWRLDGSFGGLRAVSKEIVNPPGGGTEGIWIEPLRVVDYIHFYIWDSVNGITAVERHAKWYSREVGYSDIVYQFGSHPYLEVRKTVWVPLTGRAAVVELTLTNQSDRANSIRLFAEVQSHLSQGWPLRKGGRNSAAFDAGLPGLVVRDEENPLWAAICGCSTQPQAFHLGDFHAGLIDNGCLPSERGGTTTPGAGRSCLQYDVVLPPQGAGRVVFVVTGSPDSEQEARATFAEVMARLGQLRKDRIDHYRQLFDGRAVLESPSYVLNKAFLWAKLGTEDFKHYDPRLGFLFFAGYPAYNFYFASDSMLILRGSLCFGDFEDAREMLRTIVRYQATSAGRDTLPGELWHEMSTSGDRISPNFAGFLFPGLLRYFYDWSGDRAFLEEMYPHARAVVEWGYLMDANGDGLLENGPEGEMADSAWEDRNMERSQYTVQTSWFDALRAGLGLAKLVGDKDSIERWSATQTQLLPWINRFYWNEVRRYFEETLRPDGCLDTTGKGFPNLDTDMVDEGKTVATSRLLLDEESYLSDVQAFLERQAFEEVFSTHRAYMSWYVVERGRRARELYRTHQPAPAHRALEEIAASPFHWTTPGLWPEVWAVDEPAVLRVRGCFHQAWTPSHGFIYALVDGLLGLRPDAPNGAITVDPHLPPQWPGVTLHRLRLGDGWFDIGCTQGDGWRRISVRNDTPRPLNMKAGFALLSGARLVELRVNGQTQALSSLEFSTTPHDIHAYATVNALPGQEVSAELHWHPAPLRLSIADGAGELKWIEHEPVLLPRSLAGSRCAITARVQNTTCAALRAQLRLCLPYGWPDSAGLTQTIDLAGDQTAEVGFEVAVPWELAEGYYSLRVRVEGVPHVVVEQAAYLPVFRPIALSLDGRQVAKVGVPFTLDVLITNLCRQPQQVAARARWPAGWDKAIMHAELHDLQPGQATSLRLEATPRIAGDYALPVEVTCEPSKDTWQVSHALRVLPPERPLVLYSGFLGCPVSSNEVFEVVNLPANYAVRKPHTLSQLLAHTDLVLTSDQHDAVFSEEQIAELIAFIEHGGSLAFFCYWSAPWGRGFFDTFGNFAAGRLPDVLPLHMRRGIFHARAVHLTAAGRPLFGDIAWDTIPAFDYNLAECKPGAQLLAETEAGSPLIAVWQRGRGRVLAIAIDCFGYESYVEGLSFDWWPEKPRLIRRSVERMLSKPRAGVAGGDEKTKSDC